MRASKEKHERDGKIAKTVDFINNLLGLEKNKKQLF